MDNTSYLSDSDILMLNQTFSEKNMSGWSVHWNVISLHGPYKYIVNNLHAIPDGFAVKLIIDEEVISNIKLQRKLQVINKLTKPWWKLW